MTDHLEEGLAMNNLYRVYYWVIADDGISYRDSVMASAKTPDMATKVAVQWLRHPDRYGGREITVTRVTEVTVE